MMTTDENDVKIVQSFLEKFLIGSESAFLDNIDIKPGNQVLIIVLCLIKTLELLGEQVTNVLVILSLCVMIRVSNKISKPSFIS